MAVSYTHLAVYKRPIKQFGPRIYFTHLRSTMREDNPKTFHEAAHLNGDVDMYEVVKAIVEEEHRRKAEGKEDLIPMRPDHGHQMLDLSLIHISRECS